MGIIATLAGAMVSFMILYLTIFVVGSILYKTPDRLCGNDDITKPKHKHKKGNDDEQ